jgi:uncharacterized membrane protein YgcG
LKAILRLDHHGDSDQLGVGKAGLPPLFRRKTIFDVSPSSKRKGTSRQMKALFLLIALCAGVTAQQATGTLKGQVIDELGGALVGASIVVVDANGKENLATTNGEGFFTINGLEPGNYKVRASTAGFAVYENPEVQVIAGRSQELKIILKVTIEEQKVVVNTDSEALSTEPENNQGAIVMKGADLNALPDDPDDLMAALQALAGPSAGPNGGQVFIDGFTGGRLPPLSSIREIRINANPFSAEYDRMGFGRIEIFTKPGSDKFHGQASFSFNDSALNSRNPFASDRPPFESRQYGGNVSGPISKKKASFFLDFEKRDINDDALINATILDPTLHVTPFSESVPTPNRRTTFSPRIDYQINANNTLVARYTYTHSSQEDAGVNTFSLASRAYNTANTEQTAQLTETAVLSKKVVNETRFQFIHQVTTENGDDTLPTINVLDAFQGGGAGVGLAANTQNHFELQNNTSILRGQQTLKFGLRLRYVRITDISPMNFGGTWTFSGGFAPELDANNQVVIDPNTGLPVLENISSIERYRRTLLFQQQGLSAPQIRALGGGATQFSIAAGNPEASVGQLDLGAFVQDDWKVRPNLTLNLGLRYENQDNISSDFNFAPRLGFAWSPRAGRARQPKTVIRGGFGIFYDRLSESLTLTANRLNGTNEQQFIVTDPNLLDLFPGVPATAVLASAATPITITQLANNIRAPYTMQSVISVEHQLAHNTKVAMSYINARTLHLLRTRATNAPLPGTFVPGIPDSGIRPLANNDNIFEYDSSGRFNQNQFIFNVTKSLKRNSSLTAYYVLAKANSDTDGVGTFPANSYDLSNEYGRSSLDIRHRFVLIGNIHAPWGLSLSPMIIAASGAPFNITIGRDLNGDTLFTERPAFAADLSKPGVVITRWGAFDPNPTPAEEIIPRNFGTGPSSLTTRLGISKSFGFGTESSTSAENNRRGGGGGSDGRGPIGLRGIGGGGPRGGGGARGGSLGGSDTGKRYSLTFSINIQNPLNHANLGRPDGNLSSPFFGLSTASSGNFGGFGGTPGSSAYDRRIDAQVRFSF